MIALMSFGLIVWVSVRECVCECVCRVCVRACVLPSRLDASVRVLGIKKGILRRLPLSIIIRRSLDENGINKRPTNAGVCLS